jgi:hypothetical protein
MGEEGEMKRSPYRITLGLFMFAAACGSGATNPAAPHDGGMDASSIDSGGSRDAGPGTDAGNKPDAARDAGPMGDATPYGKAPPPPGAFPGQAGNPVGYEAAPGYPGSLTPWTGGSTIATSGTMATPKVYSFQDFSAGTGGTLITGSHLKFVGCRFQSNDLENYNVQVTGSDITFEYCSVTPLVSLASAPPHPAWPSGGAGMQLIGNGTGYQIGGDDGYEYGLNDAAAQMYHTDGPGYLNGGTPPQNVSILNNTIASIGNTNGIALQAATSPYVNITMSGNYLSGFGYTADVGHETTGSTQMTVTNNTFGTDLPWVYGPIYADATELYSQATNTWSGNRLKVLAATSPISGSWPWTAADDGQFLWPNTTTHTADF